MGTRDASTGNQMGLHRDSIGGHMDVLWEYSVLAKGATEHQLGIRWDQLIRSEPMQTETHLRTSDSWRSLHVSQMCQRRYMGMHALRKGDQGHHG